jgi:hypothetical protein
VATDGDDNVGYGKPPKRTRFQPGQSGNPKGRPPRGGGNFDADLLAELCEEYLVRDNGVERKVTKQQALINTIVTAAIRGNMRAASTIFSFCAKSSPAQVASEATTEQSELDDLDLMQDFARRTQSASKKAAMPAALKKDSKK